MKIAVVTEDEITISQHFGRAPFYLVYTVLDGKIIGNEKRQKPGHNQFVDHEHSINKDAHSAEGHGHGAESHGRHLMMIDPVSDCQVMICGGMGKGAYENIIERNINPIVTEIANIDQAIDLFLKGELESRPQRLH